MLPTHTRGRPVPAGASPSRTRFLPLRTQRAPANTRALPPPTLPALGSMETAPCVPCSPSPAPEPGRGGCRDSPHARRRAQVGAPGQLAALPGAVLPVGLPGALALLLLLLVVIELLDPVLVANLQQVGVGLQGQGREGAWAGGSARAAPPPGDRAALTFSSSALREKVMLAVLSKGALGEKRGTEGGAGQGGPGRWPPAALCRVPRLPPPLCTHVRTPGPVWRRPSRGPALPPSPGQRRRGAVWSWNPSQPSPPASPWPPPYGASRQFSACFPTTRLRAPRAHFLKGTSSAQRAQGPRRRAQHPSGPQGQALLGAPGPSGRGAQGRPDPTGDPPRDGLPGAERGSEWGPRAGGWAVKNPPYAGRRPLHALAGRLPLAVRPGLSQGRLRGLQNAAVLFCLPCESNRRQ